MTLLRYKCQMVREPLKLVTLFLYYTDNQFLHHILFYVCWRVAVSINYLWYSEHSQKACQQIAFA